MFVGYILLCLGIPFVSSNIINTNEKSTFFLGNAKSDWWKTATIYQIYVKSFKDSDGDGIGDLKGVLEKLDYIQELGVQAIWLSPIFDSPQKDNGYDISDYKNIWKTYGTMEDFRTLIAEVHRKKLKIIIDFVPNHTSDKHEWFQKSVKGDPKYKDYYVWRNCTADKNGKMTKPPNNWRSCFGGSAWTFNKDRKLCYLHKFLKEQPDLNYRVDSVVNEMKDVLKFWLQKNSVDGVRIDAVPHIFEDTEFRDEVPINETDNSYNGLKHNYTEDLPETFTLIEDFRTLLENLTGDTRIEFTEATNLKYYGNGTTSGAHFTFNFQFLGLNKDSTAAQIGNMIEKYTKELREISQHYVPNWVLGNHDTHRIASKVGEEKIDALNMLTAFLPGIQVTYQGEEIGMTDGDVKCEQGQDLKEDCKLYPQLSRDFERTPFQWSSGKNAGFSKGDSTWLPVAKNFEKLNVDSQVKDNNSHLNIYRTLQRIRLNLGENAKKTVKVVKHDDKNLLHLSRGSLKDHVFEYLSNFEGKSKNITLESKNRILVLAANRNTKKAGDQLDKTFEMAPYESVIVSYVSAHKSGATRITSCYILLLAAAIWSLIY